MRVAFAWVRLRGAWCVTEAERPWHATAHGMSAWVQDAAWSVPLARFGRPRVGTGTDQAAAVSRAMECGATANNPIDLDPDETELYGTSSKRPPDEPGTSSKRPRDESVHDDGVAVETPETVRLLRRRSLLAPPPNLPG